MAIIEAKSDQIQTPPNVQFIIFKLDLIYFCLSKYCLTKFTCHSFLFVPFAPGVAPAWVLAMSKFPTLY